VLAEDSVVRATFGRLILILILLLFAIPSIAHAGIGFLFERSFTVPSLTGELTQLKFARYDTDSIPEVIATDGHTVVIYSMTGDSVIFQRMVAPNTSICESIEFADVNRDSIPDLACCVYGDPLEQGDPFRRAIVYYGSSYFADSGFVVLPMYSSPINGCHAYWGYMQVLDLNADGLDELFVSADSIEFGQLEQSLGFARLYHSFPDSISWSVGAPIASADLIQLSDGSRHIWGRTIECSYYELLGEFPPPSYFSRVISLSASGAKGSFTVGFPNPCEGSTVFNATVSPSYLFSRYDPSMQSQTELFTSSVRTYRCGSDTTTILRKTLNYHLMYTTATMENVWSIDFPSDLYGMTFIPGLSDYFFAFEGESLLMFYLADGAIRTQLSDVPAGDKFWGTPFADSIPRLIARQGNTVSLYTLDITTDSPEDGQNHQLPVTFRLASPYPNPFNAGLSIPVDVPRSGRLTVTVHNLLGQQVAELIDRDTSQGKLTLPWDASGYSSGIYFIRAKFNDQTATTKALLLK
jgi:hypothetical protein